MANVSPPDGGYNYYQRSIDDLEDEIKEDAKSREEKRQERLEAQARRHEEELRRKDEHHAKDLERVKGDAHERIQAARHNARDEVKDAKAETYDRYGRVYAQMQADREDAQKTIEHIQQDYEERARRDNTDKGRSSDAALRAEMDRSTVAAKDLRESHERETATLRNQIRDFADTDRQTLKGFNEGRAQAIREFENDFRDQQKIQNATTTAELDAVRERGRQQTRYFAAQNDRNLKDQGMGFSRLLNQTVQEAHDDRTMLEQQFQLDRQQQEFRTKKDHEYAQKVLEDRLGDAAEASSQALGKQSEAWRESYQNLAKNNSDTIKRMEIALQEARTSSDVSKISPAAEEAVREATNWENEKRNGANDARKNTQIESMQQNFRDRYTDLLADKRQNETRMAQNQALEQHQSQQAYIDSVVELAETRDEQIRQKDSSHQRASDALTHDHARALDHQRREYEDIMQNLKNDANARIGSMRQDHAFETKMSQKAFSSQQNELIRQYEKKLADQKQDSDTQIGDLKSELAMSQREGDRRLKQALEEQSKGYEQRIAQTDVQNKERERLISQNAQDELEKVKRSNALLIQKKS